ERAAEAKAKVEAYRLKKAAEAAKLEREQNARNKETHEKVAAYQAQHAPAAPKTYVVKSGDSLSKIAKEQLGDARRYPEIQKLNKLDNPNLIRVGQELLLPD
ncbi:MAG: LysM domain-containing protein, partial [Anaerolineales bacterium]